MIDFSRLRTLEDVQAERMRLEQSVAQQQGKVQHDIRTIQSTWQSRVGIVRHVISALGYIIPKPQSKTILGVLSSALIARIFRRRKS